MTLSSFAVELATVRPWRSRWRHAEASTASPADGSSCRSGRLLEPQRRLSTWGRLPSSCRQPARQADNRLTLELNCKSEDVKSYRRAKRDGGKGEPHLLLPTSAPYHLTRGREYGSRQMATNDESAARWLPSGV